MLQSRCPHCQAELPKLGRFCMMCGQRVPERTELAELSARPGRTGRKDRVAQRSAARRHRERPAALFKVAWALFLSALGGAMAYFVYAALQPKSAPAGSEVVVTPTLPAPNPASRTGTASRPNRSVASTAHPEVSALPDASPAHPAVPEVGAKAFAGTDPLSPPQRRLDPVKLDPQLADIEFVASMYSPQVRACYERAFRHAGAQAPSGRIEIGFVLTDTGDAGHATEIATELNMLGEPSVAACLEERMAEWRFPRPVQTGGAPRRLRYPFVFVSAPLAPTDELLPSR